MDCPRCKSKNSFGYQSEKARDHGYQLEGSWHCILCGHRTYDRAMVSREVVKIPIDPDDGE